MSSRIFALDIREAGLSAVAVRTGLKENHLENHLFVDFADAPDTEEKLEWAVKTAAQTIDPSGAYCLVSIPPSGISFRNITVPFKSRKKITKILPFELEPTLPFEIDKVVIDFITVRSGQQTDLIAAAVERQKLEHILEVLGQNSILPGYVTAGGMPEAFCLAEGSDYGLKDFLFIENDSFSATVCIGVSGKIFLVRTLRKTQRSADAASSAKEVSAGIRRMISAYESIYDTELEPEKLVVSGMDANDPGFLSTLENELEIKSFCLDPATDTDLKISFAEKTRPGPEKNGALCLAGVEISGLQPFNFGRRDSALEKYWNENKTRLVTVGALAFMVFVLFISRAAIETHFLQKQVSEIDAAIAEQYRAAFPGEKDITAPMRQMRSRLEQIKGENVFARQAGAGVLNIDILHDISSLIPEGTDVVITRFVRDSSGLQLAGLTGAFNAVDDVKMQLEKSEHLSGITISSANMDARAEKIRFRIKADIAGDAQ
ncbi:MAG: type II secretion system protein GspL [Thermodesulfobacteriota bacterium]